jgi:hypothetical protein
MGRFLLKFARDRGYSLALADDLESYAGTDSDNKIIYLDENLNKGQKSVSLAHELRHAHQFSSGTSLYVEVDSTKTQIQLSRAMEADAESFAGIVAYQLKNSGKKECWEAFKEDSPEVAVAIENQISKDSLRGKKNLHKAIFEGFKGWYKDYTLREKYDEDHIDLIRKVKREGLEEEIAFDRTFKVEGLVKKVCKIGQDNYFDGNPELLNKKEYLGISKKHMDKILQFFEQRHAKYPHIGMDNSVKDIPVYEYKGDGSGKRVFHRLSGKSIYQGPLKKQAQKKKDQVELIKRRKEKNNTEETPQEKKSESPKFAKTNRISETVKKIYDRYSR